MRCSWFDSTTDYNMPVWRNDGVYNFETRRNSRKEQYSRNGLRVSNQSLLRHLMGFGDKAIKRDRCFSFTKIGR